MGSYATPATYFVNGRQYLVIACGGGKMGTKSGDAYVAFALTRSHSARALALYSINVPEIRWFAKSKLIP